MNKTKKRILYTMVGLLLLIIAIGIGGIIYIDNQFFKERSNYLKFTSEFKPIPFRWHKDVYKDFIEPHSAMLIPVKLDGISRAFFMQFDTGAPYSVFAGRTLESLKSLGLKYDVTSKNDRLYIANFDFHVGNNDLNARLIRVKENYGKPIDLNDSTDVAIIGTIGADFIDNAVTVIDFKNRIINLFSERPDWNISKSKFKPFDFRGRRIMFPATIEGRKIKLFYDTGTSGFGLLTAKSLYDDYTEKNIKEIKYEANSWGNPIPVYHKKSLKKITIGGAELDLKRISYLEWHDKLQGFMLQFTKIGGLLGNKPFTESILIIDTKKEEFTVLSQEFEIKK